MPRHGLPGTGVIQRVLLAGVGFVVWSGGAWAADPPLAISRHPIERSTTAASAGSSATPRGWYSVGVLVAGAAVVGGLTWAARSGRFTAATSPAGLRIVGRLQLTARHAVHVVRVGDRLLLLGTGAGGAPTLLGEMPAEAERPGGEA